MMRSHSALMSLSLLLSLGSTSAAIASGKIYYGSRVGMTVTVISTLGLDTANAVIRTKHTQDDAVTFCREYVGKITQECVRRELETRLNDFVAANCLTGKFTDFYGKHYRFLGPNKNKNDDSEAKYRIQDASSGEIANGSSASGYGTNLEIYKALCPRHAPIDE